ncbi:MarR family winged helix-turn-helix transcriptional regulator [Lactiplantibacillus plantarum]|uniref:MarR family winged helix-turn-helix transcriptional regulator n=1 Tax=Lactiplantibacillus plantarum TaxID=1590 RepID=UPI0021A6F220|nr:MarR family winged helix-turn-helix transcriptional regulator [Lactiplantibacillus plantarum]MCT3234895.1 MarR family transcriptional regulator [Lactiplantibacillus plantarum]
MDNEENIGRLIKMLGNKLTTSLTAYGQKWDLTSMQMSIIDFIANYPQEVILQRDLEKEFNIKRSTATVLVQKMATKGLLTHGRSLVGDKRQKQIMLTDKAKDLSLKISHHLRDTDKKLLAGFSDQQVEIITLFLKQNIQGE